jgi:hypothetical protein
VERQALTALAWTIRFKIGCTVLWIVACSLPGDWLSSQGLPAPEPELFIRLLGMAWTALLVGYAIGLRRARRGQFPATAVGAGIVSNGGAFLLLLGYRQSWASWGLIPQFALGVSALALAAITLGLVVFGGRALRRSLGELFGPGPEPEARRGPGA